MKLRFTSPAYKELADGIAYYESQQEGLGERFKDAVDLGLQRILEYPEGWECYSRSTRKHTLEIFPYKVIYTIEKDIIFIIAVAHSHRKPDYWIDRI